MFAFLNNIFNTIKNTPIIYSICYKFIYLYSYCEILTNKYLPKQLLTMGNSKKKDINTIGIHSYKNGKKCPNPNAPYDLVIYNGKNVNNGIVHIIIPNVVYDVKNYYTLTNWKFVSFIVNYLDKEYEIQLYSPHYTYYVVNNIIDNAFIAYYLTNYCNIDLANNGIDNDDDADVDEINISYTGTILDENMNVVSIDEKTMILFSYDKYLIEK